MNDYFPIWILIVLVILCILIIILISTTNMTLYKKTKPHPQTKTFEKEDMYTACSSLDCVRCQKYQEIRSDAIRKINQYQRIMSSEVSRIANALHRDESFRNELQRPNVLYVADLNSSPWMENTCPQVLDTLENNFDVIMNEFKMIYRGNSRDLSNVGWKVNTTETGSWSTFYLYNQGTKIIQNCEKCPRTTSIIDNLPDIISRCVFGNILFSVLMPGTEIEEHYGPTNVRIRCHLGLQIPDSCHLYVAKEKHSWREGRCILFDDSYLHSVTYKDNRDTSRGDETGQHETGHERAVLIVDLWHPDLTDKEKNALVYTFGARI